MQRKGLSKQLSDVPDFEFLHQRKPVDLDGPHADLQARSNLTIRQAFCHETKDLPLTRGQSGSKPHDGTAGAFHGLPRRSTSIKILLIRLPRRI
jgi:hypothetical protein